MKKTEPAPMRCDYYQPGSLLNIARAGTLRPADFR
jgi:hypothetical protein